MNSNQLIDVYPDLLGQESDPALEKLVTGLATIYQRGDAPLALRKSIEAALAHAISGRPRLASTPARSPRLRWKAGAILVAAVVVILVSVVGYAVAPMIDQLLSTERGTATLPMQNIGQTQTTNGVTVKLDRAYADVNRVIVAYTIQVPAGFANSTSGIDGKIGLTDGQGLALPVIEGQGVDGNAPQTSAGLVSFDAESLAPDTSQVNLRLTFPDVRAKAEKSGGSSLDAGSFTFNFTLPIAAGQMIAVNKTLVANGVAVTLDRVVVSPSETRAYLRFPASNGIAASEWIADAHISGAGWDSRQLPAGFSGEMTLGSMFMNTRGEHVTTLSGDFRGHHGEWTLTIDALTGVDTSAPSIQGGPPKQARVAGPWVFRFSLR